MCLSHPLRLVGNSETHVVLCADARFYKAEELSGMGLAAGVPQRGARAPLTDAVWVASSVSLLSAACLGELIRSHVGVIVFRAHFP